MDKAWAAQAGLGWLAKNTCLIHPEIGSWFFLGEIFLDLELPPDGPLADHCGTCRACLDACPTGALERPYLLDARRCISYLNIEHRGPFPDPAPPTSTWSEGERFDPARAMGDWLVGCDICQEVCPWNRKVPVSGQARFGPRPALADRSIESWANLSDEEYRAAVQGTAVRRIKPADMRRNARAILRNLEEGLS
jgi:epoxyqueuosine reductase